MFEDEPSYRHPLERRRTNRHLRKIIWGQAKIKPEIGGIRILVYALSRYFYFDIKYFYFLAAAWGFDDESFDRHPL